MSEAKTLKCSCGYVYKTGNRKNVRDFETEKVRATFVCTQCLKETLIKGRYVVCLKCKAYVPYCTELCECGFKRSLTRGEAKRKLGRVKPDFPIDIRTINDRRMGRSKMPIPGLDIDFEEEETYEEDE